MAVLHCLYRFSDTKPVDSGLLGTPLFLWISARSGGVVRSCLSPGLVFSGLSVGWAHSFFFPLCVGVVLCIGGITETVGKPLKMFLFKTLLCCLTLELHSMLTLIYFLPYYISHLWYSVLYIKYCIAYSTYKITYVIYGTLS